MTLPDLKTFIIPVIVIVVATTLGVFLIKAYGTSRFDAGVASVNIENLTEGTKANDTARQNKESGARYERSLEDDQLDNALRGLGILRHNP